jgi:hypothetical protein
MRENEEEAEPDKALPWPRQNRVRRIPANVAVEVSKIPVQEERNG